MNRIIIALLKPLSFLPALLIMYMIFSFSAQDGSQSSQLSFQVSQKLVKAGAILLDKNLSPEEILIYAEQYHGMIRKLAHMTEYCILAVSLSIPLYAYKVRGIWLLLLAGFICVAFAATDEYHQTMVAGRGPSPRDVLIDSIGALAGILGTQLIGWAAVKSSRELERNRPGKRRKR